MFIIDKNKDFYDHYSHIYGVDKNITFDRRGSIILTNEFILPSIYSGVEEQFYILEIGYTQYLFKTHNFTIIKTYDGVRDYRITDFSITLLKEFRQNKSLFNKELSLAPARIPYMFKDDFLGKKRSFDAIALDEINYYDDKVQHNFIMANTKLTSILNPEIVWKDINVFISSKKNDKNIDIQNSDIDKIINHGFDKKTSFRNPIK